MEENTAFMRCGGIKNYRVGDYMSTGKKTYKIVEIKVDESGYYGEIRMRPATFLENFRLNLYHAYREVRWKFFGY